MWLLIDHYWPLFSVGALIGLAAGWLAWLKRPTKRGD